VRRLLSGVCASPGVFAGRKEIAQERPVPCRRSR
jgi:hypothetical protein